MTLRVVNKAEFDKALQKAGADALGAVDEVVEDAAIELQSLIRRGISRGPATGRVYSRGGIAHTASAPGEAPQTDTGRLVGSVRWDKEAELKASVSSNLDYAEWLEFGTRKMAPRPIWQPSLLKIEKKFGREVSGALRDSFR